jgi:hypothetical protein
LTIDEEYPHKDAFVRAAKAYYTLPVTDTTWNKWRDSFFSHIHVHQSFRDAHVSELFDDPEELCE